MDSNQQSSDEEAPRPFSPDVWSSSSSAVTEAGLVLDLLDSDDASVASSNQSSQPHSIISDSDTLLTETTETEAETESTDPDWCSDFDVNAGSSTDSDTIETDSDDTESSTIGDCGCESISLVAARPKNSMNEVTVPETSTAGTKFDEESKQVEQEEIVAIDVQVVDAAGDGSTASEPANVEELIACEWTSNSESDSD